MDGELESLSSYRAELEAIRSLTYYIRFLRRTVIEFTAEVHLKIWIDNMEALRHGTGDFRCTPRSTVTPEYDLIADIAHVCSSERIRLAGEHVKSHQEETTDTPLEVVLNEECDALAKKQVASANGEESTQPSAIMAPSDKAALFLNGQMITNRYKERIQYAVMAPSLIAHLCQRNEWQRSTADLIDWEIHEVMFEKLFRTSTQRFARIVKFVNGIQNTGRQKRMFSKVTKNAPLASDRCPCCYLCEETTMHLHQCMAPAVVEIRNTMLDELEDQLRLRHLPSEESCA